MAEGRSPISPKVLFLKKRQIRLMSYPELNYFFKLEKFKIKPFRRLFKTF